MRNPSNPNTKSWAPGSSGAGPSGSRPLLARVGADGCCEESYYFGTWTRCAPSAVSTSPKRCRGNHRHRWQKHRLRHDRRRSTSSWRPARRCSRLRWRAGPGESALRGVAAVRPTACTWWAAHGREPGKHRGRVICPASTLRARRAAYLWMTMLPPAISCGLALSMSSDDPRRLSKIVTPPKVILIRNLSLPPPPVICPS